MALWCKDLPVVTVERSSVPKPVTLILPYYENPGFLETQIQGWRTLPRSVTASLRAIVVDDGSPDTPAWQVVRDSETPFPLAVYRIDVDVRWNWLAARNIGAHEARPGWLLLTDMDHVVPAETFESVIYGVHDTRVVYAFQRKEHTGERANPHSASFLMTRDLFWKIGGYDEALSGFYGTDGDYRRRVAMTAPIQVLRDAYLIRHEYQGDSSTRRYLRKQPQDAAVRKLVQARRPGWTPKVLSFPYRRESHAEQGATC